MRENREIKGKKWKEIENKVGVEGAKSISEGMKYNNTLTELNLGSKEKWRRDEQRKGNEIEK